MRCRRPASTATTSSPSPTSRLSRASVTPRSRWQTSPNGGTVEQSARTVATQCAGVERHLDAAAADQNAGEHFDKRAGRPARRARLHLEPSEDDRRDRCAHVVAFAGAPGDPWARSLANCCAAATVRVGEGPPETSGHGQLPRPRRGLQPSLWLRPWPCWADAKGTTNSTAATNANDGSMRGSVAARAAVVLWSGDGQESLLCATPAT
jgi:hypothetical protein